MSLSPHCTVPSGDVCCTYDEEIRLAYPAQSYR